MENVWTYREMEFVNVRLGLDCHIAKKKLFSSQNRLPLIAVSMFSSLRDAFGPMNTAYEAPAEVRIHCWSQ